MDKKTERMKKKKRDKSPECNYIRRHTLLGCSFKSYENSFVDPLALTSTS